MRLFAEARIDGLYDGIDAIFYLDDGRPRYDLIVAAGADPPQVRMKIEGSNGVSLGADGSLAIATTMGVLEQRGLYAYQEIGGERQQVACRFVVSRDQRVSFAMGSYDRTRPLVIDPLVYSTYLGGNDTIRTMASQSMGAATPMSPDSPTRSDFPTLNEYQTDQSSGMSFVTKLAYSGSGNVSLVYSTYLGGDNSEIANGIAVDGSGNAYITGYTHSTDFPTLNQYQSEQASDDVFVTKLAYSGNGSVSLVYSTYLGGSDFDQGYGIAVDRERQRLCHRLHPSTDFPTLNQYQSHQTSDDAFVTKLAYSGSGSVSLVYSTYLGGGNEDRGTGIAVDDERQCLCHGIYLFNGLPDPQPVSDRSINTGCLCDEAGVQWQRQCLACLLHLSRRDP